MKYVLDPDNRNCPDDVLFGDLETVANQLGKRAITKDEYNRHGRFSASTMQKRFGSWNEALHKAGLSVAKRMSIPKDELIADLVRVSDALGTNVVTTTEYASLGKFAVPTLQHAFGSWPAAVRSAGLAVSPLARSRVAVEDLFTNMAELWGALGRQPKQADLVAPRSKLSHDVYVRRFGSWRAALEAFVDSANSSEKEPSDPTPVSAVVSQSEAPRSPPRDPSWRLRFLVYRRDRFTCVACGRSPATHLGVVLHVDHVVPWSRGGLTVLPNLQTLCGTCNIGKSDLPMNIHAGVTPDGELEPQAAQIPGDSP